MYFEVFPPHVTKLIRLQKVVVLLYTHYTQTA